MVTWSTLDAGATKATRFIFDGCCARAASGHVAAVPPKSVMKSRRCMYPPLRENLIDASSLTLCDGAAGGKGQPIDHRRCDPMSELVKADVATFMCGINHPRCVARRARSSY